jgi:hypothetical protein
MATPFDGRRMSVQWLGVDQLPRADSHDDHRHGVLHAAISGADLIAGG